MSATVTTVQTARPPGSQKYSVSTVAFDSSYVTGGEPVTAAQLGLRYVEWAITTVSAVGGSVNVANAVYDTTNEKVILYDETPAQVASEANVEGVKVQVVAFGH